MGAARSRVSSSRRARPRLGGTPHVATRRSPTQGDTRTQPGTHTVGGSARSVEGLELVRLHRRLVLVQVAERVLGAVVVGVVVRVDGLRLEAGNRVELLDRRG